MSTAQGQAAVARGSLAETPVTNLLLYLYRKTSEGTLVLRAPDGRSATIRFRNGRPTAALFSDGKTSQLLGGLATMCGLREGQYEFFNQDLIGGDQTAVQGAVDPYALLMATLRDHPRDELVEETLARYEGTAMRIQPGRDVGRLGLRPEEQAVIDFLRAEPLDPPTLIAQAPLPNRRAARVVYALLVTHMIAPHKRESSTSSSQVRPVTGTPTASRPRSGAKPAPKRAQPAARKPAAANEWAARGTPASNEWAARGTGKHVGTMSFKDIPAVAGPLPAWQRLASLRPGGAAPSKRKSSTESFVPPDASDETRLEYATKLMAKGRAADAQKLVDEVLTKDGDNPDALALKAHTMFVLALNRTRGLPKEIMDTVRRCLRTEPDHARALLVKGLIFKEAGEHKKALTCFRRSVAEDPKNIEAQRELRLARMRHG